MEERIIAAADLGTTKTALAVAKITGERVEILYYKERPSAGIRYSCIFNPMKAAGNLKEAVAEAETELKMKIDRIYVGKPRYPIIERAATGKVERSDAGEAITRDEVWAVKNFATDSYDGIEHPDKEVIYGAIAQSFGTEDGIILSEDDVIGMPSAYLEGNFKIFIGSRKPLGNIDAVLNSIGVAEAGQYFLMDAAARAVLTRDELDNGVAFVEMGGGVTSVSIYKGGLLRHYAAIPFGGKNVTTDIRYECGISQELAENIKMAYGCCIPERLLSYSDKIIQIDDDLDGSQQQIPVKDLSAIITAREEEIIDAVLYMIQESGYADKLRSGVVLSGGGAEMGNIAMLFSEKSGYNVRRGLPRLKNFSIDGITGLTSPAAAATIGLILLAKDNTGADCAHDTAPEPEENFEGTVFEAHAAADEEKKAPAPKPGRKSPKATWSPLKKAMDDTMSGLMGIFNDLK